MDDKTLEEISGQSGVSFYVDITMDIHIGTLAWGDSDGLGQTWPGALSVVSKGGYAGAADLTLSGLSLLTLSPNSVSFWPESGSINVTNGVPFTRTNTGSGNR